MIPKRIQLALLATASLAISAWAKDGMPDRVVIVPVANMYSAPNRSADVVSQALLGSNVTTLEKKRGWVRIQTADLYAGWVEKKQLRDDKKHLYANSGDTVQVTSLFANVYRETDVTQHAPIVTLPFETRVEVLARQSDRWLQIRLPDRQEGWIQTGDVTAQPKVLSIPESIDLGKKFLGIPYLWGGRSSFGYDCSGFTQMLVRSRGIFMPRDADQQASWSGAISVERTSLQAGDLLFFGSSLDKITHTGMYIGGGEFIHDTTNTHPMVQISKLDDEPWTHLLVASRRVK